VYPGLLILVFTALFIFTFIDIFKTDIFFGGVYFFLFVYTIFAQIGYVFFPALSDFWGVYFGPDIFYNYIIFIIMSFLSFYLVFKFFYKAAVNTFNYKITEIQPYYIISYFHLFIIAHIVYMFFSFFNFYEFLTYANVQEESLKKELGLSYSLFIIGFQQSIYIILVFYVTFRMRENIQIYSNKYLHAFYLCAEVILFFAIAIKSGNRNLVLALALGILMFEITYSKMTIKKISKMALLSLITVCLLVYIERIRADNYLLEVLPIYAQTILKDYFLPSHMLFAVIHLKFIDIFEVIRSNLSNSLIMLNYPYLQATVSDLFWTGDVTRSQSMAFYIFTEGYIALGTLGFIYNGIVVFCGLMMWRIMSFSNNKYYNMFIISIISTQMVNIVRAQSSYFLKDIYLSFIPAMILFYFMTGLYPFLRRRLDEAIFMYRTKINNGKDDY